MTHFMSVAFHSKKVRHWHSSVRLAAKDPVEYCMLVQSKMHLPPPLVLLMLPFTLSSQRNPV